MADPEDEPTSGTSLSGRLPPPKINIGVTGHRLDRLGAAGAARVRPLLDAVFAMIEQANGAHDRPGITLITSLADGTDSLAADCAVARGWAVDAVLPFVRDLYAGDFSDGEPRESYFRLVDACRKVMELAGSQTGDHERNMAYERAGRVLLMQCDVLIAVWDGGPVRGRGGAAQIVSEAVQLGIPVVHIDPLRDVSPVLVWDGLEEFALGFDTVDSVAHASLDALPDLVRKLVMPPTDPSSAALIGQLRQGPRKGLLWAPGFPLVQAMLGVRRLRRGDFVATGIEPRGPGEVGAIFTPDKALGGALQDVLAPRYAAADATAADNARLFRHGYISNFTLAALAVFLSLLGLVLPAELKLVLVGLELAIMATILHRIRRGNRAGWHRSWLDNRALAERLRCLAISARLGDLNLNGGIDRRHDWVAWYCKATAREIGLPGVGVDTAYLVRVRKALRGLIDGQLAYFENDCQKMERLDHRLHLLGTWLFGMTAISCLVLLLVKALGHLLPGEEFTVAHVTTGVTILSATLPAFGSAIYGIRMQGDFSGTAERARALAEKLQFLTTAIGEGEPDFDGMSRCARGLTALLTADVSTWFHATSARPLTLPG